MRGKRWLWFLALLLAAPGAYNGARWLVRDLLALWRWLMGAS